MRMTNPECSRSLRTCSHSVRRARNHRLVLTLVATETSLSLELLERIAGRRRRCRRFRSVITENAATPPRRRMRDPPACRSASQRASILAINTLAQPLARLEIRRVPGRKRHRRPGPGVAGDPRGAQSDREAAEAPDLDSPATGRDVPPSARTSPAPRA